MAAKKVMSIAMEGDFQEKLKALAEKKGVSVSSLIRETCEKYLFADDKAVKIVLSIPHEIANNSSQVESWLQQKFQAIINHFKS